MSAGQHEFEYDRAERRVKCSKCGAYQNDVTGVLCPGKQAKDEAEDWL